MEMVSKRLFNWASILEPETLEQARRTAAMPFVFPHLALMPDAHLGKGATVGSVIPTLGAIIPAAVGVDIGCGMIAVRTQFQRSELPPDLARLRVSIERAIPLSAGGINQRLTETAAVRVKELEDKAGRHRTDPDSVTGKWRLQLGSLGSGNHFIEVTVDELNRVWLFLHSGSRGVGNLIAQRHIKVARKLMEKWWIQLPDLDLAYLVEGTDEFWAYIRDLRWAQHFALLNREEMMDRVVACLSEYVGEPVDRHDSVNCLAGETPVLTRGGSIPIADLAGSEHELLTTGGVWVKAPVRSFGKQALIEVVLSRSGVMKTIRATAQHRWLLLTRRGLQIETTTSELRPGHRLQYVFPRRPDGRAVDAESVARGFVYGDGSRNGNRSVANFCGAKDDAMLPFFRNYRKPRTYRTVTRITGLPGEWKTERPPLDSPAAVLYGWLAGYFAADGDVDATGRPTLASASRENLEYVRALGREAGVGTFGIRTRWRKGFGSVETPLYLLGLMRADLDDEFFLIPAHRARYRDGVWATERRAWNVVSVAHTNAIEEVYCAVVESTHTFCLEDNILTGNCHHNFTQRETHFDKSVWLSRKGAIEARAGQPGLIPGSMGSASYVVSGLGNKMSLNSSPHGAGRNYSRTKARKTFTHEQLREAMKGIEYRDTDAFLDEIPMAYKDIDQVMADAAELVEIRHTLRQIVNVKGE